MAALRNNVKQVAYRNGVKQVAYRDGVKVVAGDDGVFESNWNPVVSNPFTGFVDRTGGFGGIDNNSFDGYVLAGVYSRSDSDKTRVEFTAVPLMPPRSAVITLKQKSVSGTVLSQCELTFDSGYIWEVPGQFITAVDGSIEITVLKYPIVEQTFSLLAQSDGGFNLGFSAPQGYGQLTPREFGVYQIDEVLTDSLSGELFITFVGGKAPVTQGAELELTLRQGGGTIGTVFLTYSAGDTWQTFESGLGLFGFNQTYEFDLTVRENP